MARSKHFSSGKPACLAARRRLALPHPFFPLFAAPTLQCSVRQHLTEPQHGLGSQRLVEGEAGHFLTSRVSLRRMRSLPSGQSFSSEGHGTSSPSASAASSCSSATTTPITTVHVYPVCYHHSTSYFLQMEPYPDPPPSDGSAVMPGHSESWGYRLSLFFLSSLPSLSAAFTLASFCLLAAAWSAWGGCPGASSPCPVLSQPWGSFLRSASPLQLCALLCLGFADSKNEHDAPPPQGPFALGPKLHLHIRLFRWRPCFLYSFDRTFMDTFCGPGCAGHGDS